MLREPELHEIEEIERAHRGSRFGDGGELLGKFAPPETWAGTRGRIIAGRLIGNLGAGGRSRRLVLATWRRDPAEAAARYYMALDYHERHGPVETLRLLDELASSAPALARPTEPGDDEPVRWTGLLRARCLAQCRDFSAAEPWLEAAERAAPDDPWLQVEKAMHLEHSDRYSEALEATARSLEIRPGYARAMWQRAHLLMLMQRDDEAGDMLVHGIEGGQSPHLPLQLATLESERGRIAGALAAIEVAATRFPLAEEALANFLRSRRADFLHRLGRDAEAAEAARGLKGRYWEIVQPRLAAAAGSSAPRRQLAVPFVRQHHMTCAPATLSAVSVFLGAPVDHLEMARAITYDGTPDHEERHWLETHGWCVREFRVTWEVARAIVARGLPFTLVTTWVGSAHLQAVVGCDEVIGTLIIRDPYQREAHETLATELLEQQAPFGPRGMVFVPEGRQAQLDGLELPDAADYDDWFRLRRALVRHDRATAAAAATRIQAASPGSRLALWAQRELAYYDDNPARALSAVSALRGLFPRETNLQLEELNLLNRLGHRGEHRERVAEVMAAGRADPSIWREQIELWRADAREHGRALRLARRYLRARPYDWLARATLAHVHWDAREFAPALALYRLAAAAGDKVEAAWQSYFAAARHPGGAAAALAMLRTRRARIGAGSSQPTITLARALDQIDRGPEAAETLASGRVARPDDGDLLIESALSDGRVGRFESAAAHLEAARARVAPMAWQRIAARLAAWRADHTVALQHHEEVLAANPLDQASLAEAARLRALTKGPAATLTWLGACVRNHPHHLPLRQLRIEWLREFPPEQALAETDEFLTIEPAHAWALRERALILLRAGRPQEAVEPARQAEAIEPGVPQSAGILGQALLACRDLPAARDATMRALRLDIAADWLMAQLLETCAEFAEREAAVEFIRSELERQPAPVTGFLRFRSAAIGVLTPERLAGALEALRAGRLESWEPWSACIQQAVATGRPADALRLAKEATERFPLVPRAWLDLADAHGIAGDAVAEEAALVRARELSPGWRDVAFRLATLLLRTLRANEAVRVLRAALAHDPLDAGLRGRLADALWLGGQHDEAIAAAERTIEAVPGWEEPWNRLAEWWRERREPERAVALAQRVVGQRPGDAAARRQLARILNDRGEHEAALAAATEAARLAPADADSHDLRAWLLALRGRRDEALAACAPEALPNPPTSLRGRAAWVRWQFRENKGAIEAMRAVTAAHPDYAWGWQQLAEWHDAVQETREAADAAQKLAELRPGDATAWGWVASFRLKERDFTAATPLLERALRIDPSYGYAAFHLLRIHGEAARWEEAQRVLGLIGQHNSRWRRLRCEILLLRFRKEMAAALDRMAELAMAPAHETGNLAEAAEEFATAGWTVDLQKRLRGVIATAGCNPEAAAIWMRLRLRAGTFLRPRVRWLERHVADEAVRRAAWIVYLEWLAEKRSGVALRWHLWRRGAWLAAADRTWGTVSYVLAHLGWHRRLAAWMADWRARAAAEPWMLSNLAHALIDLDRMEELEAVVAAALRLPADQTRPNFIAWAALAAAMAGRHAEAERRLGEFENSANNAFAALTAAQARAIVDVTNTPTPSRRLKLAEVRATLRRESAAREATAAIGYMARQQRRALLTAARIARSPWRWWYAVPVVAAGRIPVGPSFLIVAAALLLGVVAFSAGSPGMVGAPGLIGVLVYCLVKAKEGSARG
ncbi:MAG: tetratricopeptide repeat protein [Opitutaceae bacterium]|nr:tetratricopeptide repeat protein [Opitutaceae bacterium]